MNLRTLKIKLTTQNILSFKCTEVEVFRLTTASKSESAATGLRGNRETSFPRGGHDERKTLCNRSIDRSRSAECDNADCNFVSAARNATPRVNHPFLPVNEYRLPGKKKHLASPGCTGLRRRNNNTCAPLHQTCIECPSSPLYS